MTNILNKKLKYVTFFAIITLQLWNEVACEEETQGTKRKYKDTCTTILNAVN